MLIFIANLNCDLNRLHPDTMKATFGASDLVKFKMTYLALLCISDCDAGLEIKRRKYYSN